MLDPTYPGRRKNGDWNLQAHGSVLVERVLEYQFLAAVTPELLRRGLRFEVLRGDCDLDGHDVVIEADGIMRHIQLKAMAAGGKASRVDVNTRLAAKPSGCVVWMTYDPITYAVAGWRWFGGAPGQRLPELGDHIATHTRGAKAERPHIRVLRASRFTRVPAASAVVDCLFGPAEFAMLRRHLQDREETADGSFAQVQAGNFAAVPNDLDWEQSVKLAHLIDGYVLAEQLGLGDGAQYADHQLGAARQNGIWPGNAAELWITLFLEHRRWRFSAPHVPDPEMKGLLDRLVRQLRSALTGEEC